MDGGQHTDRKNEDEIRNTELEKTGYFVMRFWNNEVTENTDGVLEEIRRHLSHDDSLGKV